ncbi:Alpha-1B adrenergic receptor [Holothuria leucospilota]|uniref:Alpha-1B adrenergic receptor n=1 Tax=Holothuria leucospilota TaxID=206669 RepID=A0A9Q1HFZ0_HOLLE|nr:Alpha-1B adrenergic receptor [Holothuria leucospilota]
MNNSSSFIPTLGGNDTSAERELTRLASFSAWWILSITVILANILVLMLFVAEKCLRSQFNYFVVNLAVADLCVGFTIIPSVGLTGALPMHQFFREQGCLIVTSYANVILTVTSFCLILISCNRIYEAALPDKRHTKCLKMKVICANIAVWVTSAVIWILVRMAEFFSSVLTITSAGSTCLKYDDFSYISLAVKAACFFWGPFIVMTLLSIKIALMSRSNLIMSKIMAQTPTKSNEAVTNTTSEDGEVKHSCDEHIEGYSADSGIWIGKESVKKRENDHYQSNNKQGVLSPSVKVEQDFVLSNGWRSASTEVISSKQICPSNEVADTNLIKSTLMVPKATNSTEAVTNIISDDGGDRVSCNERIEGYYADSGIWIGEESDKKQTDDNYQSNNLQGVLSTSIKVEHDFVLSNGWRSAFTKVIPSDQKCPTYEVVDTNLITSKVVTPKPTNSSEEIIMVSEDSGDGLSCDEQQEGFFADSGIWIGKESVNEETSDHYQSNKLQGVLSTSIKVEHDFVLSNGWRSAFTKIIPSDQKCPNHGVVDTNLITSKVVATKPTNSSEAEIIMVSEDSGDGLSCDEQQDGYFADSGIWIGKESVNEETNDHYQSNKLQGVLAPSIKVEQDFVLSNGWRSAYSEVIPSKEIHHDDKVVDTTLPSVAGECQRNSSMAREIQSTTCVFYILLLVFSLFRLPLGILHIYYISCHIASIEPSQNSHLGDALFFLFLSTSLTNPVVSIVFQPKFRKTLYLLVCRFCCWCRSG